MKKLDKEGIGKLLPRKNKGAVKVRYQILDLLTYTLIHVDMGVSEKIYTGRWG